MGIRRWRLQRRRSRRWKARKRRLSARRSSAIACALLSVLRAGDEVIATRQLYGGSYRLLRDIFPRFGIGVRHVDRLGGHRKAGEPANQSVLCGDANQSDAAAGRLAEGGRVREGMGLGVDYGQHLCHSGATATAGHGIQHGGAQRHEISGRPFGRDRRRDRGQRGIDSTSA